jgi:hypothetical protein
VSTDLVHIGRLVEARKSDLSHDLSCVTSKSRQFSQAAIPRLAPDLQPTTSLGPSLEFFTEAINFILSILVNCEVFAGSVRRDSLYEKV